jgi:hypothetical protein
MFGNLYFGHWNLFEICYLKFVIYINEAKRLARTLGPGGEFVLASVRNVQSDVALENIIAMVEAASKYSTYPIQV